MRWTFFILPLILFHSVSGQEFTIDRLSTIYIGSSAGISVGMDATIYGNVQNGGLLSLKGDVNVQSNTPLGNVEFKGERFQVLNGEVVDLDRLIINNARGVQLQTDSLIANSLFLDDGVLFTTGSALLVEEETLGGNDFSHIEGGLWQKSKGSRLEFPMGIEGSFNALSMNNVPNEGFIKVEIHKPLEQDLTPGDSLTGLATKACWRIDYLGSVASSKLSIDFSGFDLQNLSNAQPIRAFRYSPVIAFKDGISYRPLGTQEILSTDSVSFGNITSSKTILLEPGKTNELALGIMPISTGLRFYVPNVFSPNSNLSENRTFRPFLKGIEIDFIEMTIWDNFNSQVYHISQASPDLDMIGWDGNNGSSKSPQGIYFYKVFVHTISGSFDESGSFLLLP
ncbi:MAG: hypothetical protein RJQ09_05545 [Cyclobacteriaceae bacterium]